MDEKQEAPRRKEPGAVLWLACSVVFSAVAAGLISMLFAGFDAAKRGLPGSTGIVFVVCFIGPLVPVLVIGATSASALALARSHKGFQMWLGVATLGLSLLVLAWAADFAWQYFTYKAPT